MSSAQPEHMPPYPDDPWESAHALMDRNSGGDAGPVRRLMAGGDAQLDEDYIQVFTSSNGARVLEDLKRRFGGSALGRTPDESHARAAMAEVILHIENTVASAIAKR